MKMISFVVPAVPIAQPRQRHRVGKVNGKAMAMNYTPTKHPVNEYKAAVKMAMAAEYDGPPLEGPLNVSLRFVFPRPKAMVWKTKDMPRVRHAKKPDRDNCEKATLDALKGLLFLDDSQVCAGAVEKWIAGGDEQAHVEVRVTELLPEA